MTMHAIRRRGIVGAAALLLLLLAAPAVRASVWGYRVYCSVPTKWAIPVDVDTYPTREECWDSARTSCQSLARWCAYALREHDMATIGSSRLISIGAAPRCA
jgi:hypothetical protein